MVLAGCRSFLLLVTTVLCDRSLAASKAIKCGPSIKRDCGPGLWTGYKTRTRYKTRTEGSGLFTHSQINVLLQLIQPSVHLSVARVFLETAFDKENNC